LNEAAERQGFDYSNARAYVRTRNEIVTRCKAKGYPPKEIKVEIDKLEKYHRHLLNEFDIPWVTV
jgi:hypothetical protein